MNNSNISGDEEPIYIYILETIILNILIFINILRLPIYCNILYNKLKTYYKLFRELLSQIFEFYYSCSHVFDDYSLFIDKIGIRYSPTSHELSVKVTRIKKKLSTQMSVGIHGSLSNAAIRIQTTDYSSIREYIRKTNELWIRSNLKHL